MSNAALVAAMTQILCPGPVGREEYARRRDAVSHALISFGYKRVSEVTDEVAPAFVRLFKERYLEADPVLQILSAYEIM